MMFGSFSVFHWIWFVLFVVAVAYPIGRILKRIGYSPLWAILAFVPFINLIGLWIIALIEWPNDRS